MRQRLWWLVVPVALGLGALTWAGVPTRERAMRHYTCELGTRVIALEGGKYVQLMVGGRPYELTWTSTDLARGQGLEWRTTTRGANLKRTSSQFPLANACVERSSAY